MNLAKSQFFYDDHVEMMGFFMILKTVDKVKVTFTDIKGNDMNELINMHNDSDPKEFLILFGKQLLKLDNPYTFLFKGKWTGYVKLVGIC